MPYIKQEKRDKLISYDISQKYDTSGSPSDIIHIELSQIDSPGDLNFIISTLLFHYVEDKGESYQIYNDLIGALECAKLELYRRHVARLEDQKIETNGDI